MPDEAAGCIDEASAARNVLVQVGVQACDGYESPRIPLYMRQSGRVDSSARPNRRRQGDK